MRIDFLCFFYYNIYKSNKGEIMNKKFTIILITVVLISFCFLFSACNTYSLDYNEKINTSKQYSLKMVYTINNQEPLYITCFYRDGNYAYRISSEMNGDVYYRQIFIDNKMYLIEESLTNGFWNGRYKIIDNVKPYSDLNKVYKYTSQITSTSVVTTLSRGSAETVNDIECIKYSYSGADKNITYFFSKNDNLLVKFNMLFDGNLCEINYSDYNFSMIITDCFIIPSSPYYTETDTIEYDFLLY